MTKILIVEDDGLLGQMYRSIFEIDNFEVKTASDGQMGIEMVNLEKPDVVLLDIMLPKINGIQVLEKIKSEESTKIIPVIMLSNLSGEQDERNSLSKGAARYLVKSAYTPREVREIVKEVLGLNNEQHVPASI